ncbi:MAG: hypothetical protein HXY35_08450 [Chloroflexi bacterium]|nr:hypothetical protein [Chloroflexota bacterium]
MADKPTFNINEAHQHFSVEYFNKAWEYIEKSSRRSEEDNLNMLHTAIASLWHWSQREDVTAENLAVGYWQVSRVYNLIKQPHNARTYGLLSLKYADGLDPFFKAYAYETLARAEMQCNNRVIMMVYLDKAYKMLELIENEEDKQVLKKDLETIK